MTEACPALFAWHPLAWEERLNENVETSPAEDDILVEQTTIDEKPVIKEWRTINGERKIDNDFAKNMTVGY